VSGRKTMSALGWAAALSEILVDAEPLIAGFDTRTGGTKSALRYSRPFRVP